jgi:hypothetical protein
LGNVASIDQSSMIDRGVGGREASSIGAWVPGSWLFAVGNRSRPA